jgi:hypothetical protein
MLKIFKKLFLFALVSGLLGAGAFLKQEEDLRYEFGVRSFMLDLYWYQPWFGGDPYVALCHETSWSTNVNSCSLTQIASSFVGPQSLESYLKQIKQWLACDERAIITLHLESHLGSKGKEAVEKLLEATGLKEYLYSNQFFEICTTEVDPFAEQWWPGVHEVPKSWPTLKEMRDKGGRLVIFSNNLDKHMLSVTSYCETKYDLGISPNCEMRLNATAVRGNQHLVMMNHFYSVNVGNLLKNRNYNEVNAYRAIMERAEKCYSESRYGLGQSGPVSLPGQWPNFIAVDFVEVGNDGGARSAVFNINTQKIPSLKRDLGPSIKKEEL